MSDSTLYRVTFHNQGKVYEVYCREVTQPSLYGFVEIGDFVFGEASSDVVIDPAEERLQAEFGPVRRTYVPMHAVVRIDEVEERGTAKITEASTDSASNIMTFPGMFGADRRS